MKHWREKVVRKSIKEQKQINLKLVNLLTRFSNLTTLHLLINDVENSNTEFLFESCTKLITLSICCIGNAHTIKMFNDIKSNCEQIKCIRMASENSTFEEQFLKKICKLFPQASISVYYKKDKVIFPVSVDLSQNTA